MGKKLILQRDIANALLVLSGAAIANYGAIGFALFFPTVLFASWHTSQVEKLIVTAMKLALGK